jgi:metal-responsive CopG/Arc/MetJ family transcriptional regulator
MNRRQKKTKQNRLTISLGQGQREELETIAQKNHTSLSFVIRHALNYFILDHKDKQLRLDLPS